MHSNKSSKYTKQNLTELQGDIKKFTSVGNFNISQNERSSRRKNNSKTETIGTFRVMDTQQLENMHIFKH